MTPIRISERQLTDVRDRLSALISRYSIRLKASKLAEETAHLLGYPNFNQAVGTARKLDAGTAPETLPISLNTCDEYGSVVDSDYLELSAAQLSEIVDRAAQTLLLRRAARWSEMASAWTELEDALVAARVITKDAEAVEEREESPGEGHLATLRENWERAHQAMWQLRGRGPTLDEPQGKK